jgi:RNA polymerase sigma-70 factor (ECF subfamily)
MEDSELVSLAREGRPGAYEELVRKYEAKVYSMALNFTRNREEALDIAQEVFLKAFQALPGFHARSEFGTWLYRISINHIKDVLRKRKRSAEVSLEDVGEQAASTGDPVRDTEEARQQATRKALVHRAIAELPEKYRLVLTLRDIQGLPYERIAEVLRISPGTVDSRLHRARKLLRTRLLPYLREEGGAA